jgi:hypothetical protein
LRFAESVFRMGGTWGLVVLTPLCFLFDEIGRQFPPAIKHPDFYYGFLGLGNLVGAVGIEIASPKNKS